MQLLFISGIGPTETMIILLVALLVFGGRLPQVARGLGKSLTEFRRGMRDLTSEIDRDPPPAPRPPQRSLPRDECLEADAQTVEAKEESHPTESDLPDPAAYGTTAANTPEGSGVSDDKSKASEGKA